MTPRPSQLQHKDCVGVKTGVTPTAGPCFAGMFQLEGKNITIVLFKTSGLDERFTEAAFLLESVRSQVHQLPS